MRGFVITDTHFGARSNNLDWLSVMMKYFKEEFIPYCRENVREGDVLIHSGDLFDSRQSLNLIVMCEVIRLFEELSTIFEKMYIIPGNHDVAKKTDNDISSLECIKLIPNLKIIKDYEHIQLGNFNTLFMAWQHTKEKCNQVLLDSTADIVFAHSDFFGVTFDGVRDIKDGIIFSDIKKFKRVYSGHIHHRQEKDNLLLLGTQYQITRTDGNNVKGFYVIDFDDLDETFIPNFISPKFVKVYVNDKFLNKKIHSS